MRPPLVWGGYSLMVHYRLQRSSRHAADLVSCPAAARALDETDACHVRSEDGSVRALDRGTQWHLALWWAAEAEPADRDPRATYPYSLEVRRADGSLL